MTKTHPQQISCTTQAIEAPETKITITAPKAQLVGNPSTQAPPPHPAMQQA